MIQVDTHPEELLDRIASNTASADEIRELEEHASKCPACAAHLSLRPVIRSSLEPSLEDRMSNERAVSRAMGTLSAGAPRRSPRSVWLLAAAAVLVTGMAGARYWARARPATVSATGDSTPAPAAKETPPSPTNAPPSAPENAEAIESATAADKGQARSQSAAEPRETAAQVFAEANELRRTGKDSQAMVTYRKVERLFPGSPEAQQSYATLGSLMMEHGNPQEALGQFDHYIEHGGPLLVDVLAGKANALQKLGRNAEERRTWETLLERFPKSVQAARAKTRLAELH
jgi:TolA-binding protein